MPETCLSDIGAQQNCAVTDIKALHTILSLGIVAQKTKVGSLKQQTHIMHSSYALGFDSLLSQCAATRLTERLKAASICEIP